jgi:hypothetical protein
MTRRWTDRLPKGQKDNQLDGEDLQKRRVVRNILTDLEIELNQAIHGNRDGSRLDDQNLPFRIST